MNALVQADRGVQLFLQLDVAVEIVPAERLFDHHQVEAFELLEERPVIQCVGGVVSTISLMRGKSWRSRRTGLRSFPGLIFILMR